MVDYKTITITPPPYKWIKGIKNIVMNKFFVVFSRKKI